MTFRVITTTICAGLLIGLGFSFGLTHPPETAQGQIPAASRVAYFDILTVFDNSRKRISKRDELTLWIKGQDERLQELEKEVQSINSQLSLTGPGTEEHARLSRTFHQKRSEMQWFKQYAEEEAARQWTKFRDDHLEEIRQVVEEYASRNEIDMVVQKDIPIPDRSADKPERLEIVFYAKPECDITDAILKLVNGK